MHSLAPFTTTSSGNIRRPKRKHSLCKHHPRYQAQEPGSNRAAEQPDGPGRPAARRRAPRSPGQSRSPRRRPHHQARPPLPLPWRHRLGPSLAAAPGRPGEPHRLRRPPAKRPGWGWGRRRGRRRSHRGAAPGGWEGAAPPGGRGTRGRGQGSGEGPPPSPLPWRLGGAALGGSNGGASRSRPVSLRGRPRPFHFRRCLGVNIRVSAEPPRPLAAAPPISARLAGHRQVWSAARERGGEGREGGAGRTIPPPRKGWRAAERRAEGPREGAAPRARGRRASPAPARG